VPGGRVTRIPLETYVARVRAGEGEPDAAAAARQALAVAIRTYALANARRHGGDGFDVCDSTHCQVLRAATAVTRAAALATAGRVLTYNGRPAEVFYSASCGGRSESASQVWPGADYPYLQVAEDDVHDADVPWTFEVTLGRVQQALQRAGFAGQRLRAVEVEERSSSGRVARLRLGGLRPDVVSGDQFRLAVGAAQVRSTAFSVETHGDRLLFTGRGYGHGVGMCVVGAGRRALRGESLEAILSKYFPGLVLTSGSAPPEAPVAAAAAAAPVAGVDAMVARAHAELSKTLGTAVAPITVVVHRSVESFRIATGQPWWVSVVGRGTAIDLGPAPVLMQREGIDAAIRQGVAELLVAGPLAGRPAWVRVGAARHFARNGAAAPLPRAQVRCPADAELTLAISAAAQREAEVRAEACFARALARTGDWRAVR
jgi:SpoIID/LytB domain protein